MFYINEDLSIYVTRGDVVCFSVSADNNGESYKFQPGDVVRIKVFGKKDCENVVLQKDFPVTTESETVEIFLTEQDTKIGGVISKHKDYWYEVELNPESNPHTIIGYDDDGAKMFRLFPEGRDLTENDPVIIPEDIPIIDTELDLTSKRPVENQAIARAVERLKGKIKGLYEFFYPVGSVWLGGKDNNGNIINPANIFGGKWVLIDKGFKHTSKIVTFDKNIDGDTYYGADGYNTRYNALYMDKMEIYYHLAGNVVRFRISCHLKPGKTFNDDGVQSFIEMNWTDFGFTQLSGGVNDIACYNDHLNSLGIIMSVNFVGQISQSDVIGSSRQLTIPDSMTEPITIDFTTPINMAYMLDSFCDKFYWQRTK